MTTQPPPTAPADSPEQRASWLELFFDLVVVVAIALLADRVREQPDLEHVALVLLLYLAIWLVWVSFMLYANIAGDHTHRRSMIIAMGCIAVMAASIPGIDADGAATADRARAFAVAYVVARVLAVQVWRSTATALVDWPIAQLSVGLTPWIASIFVRDPARYWLWVAGVALDIGFALGADDPKRILAMIRHDKGSSGRPERRDRPARRQRTDRPERPERPEIVAVSVNVSHFEERLGTFMIIVLGEAVSQIVMAVSGRGLTGGLGRAAAAAFLVLVGMWWLTFQYGFASSPESRLARIPARYGLPIHFVTTASIVYLAAGLGEGVAKPLARLGDPARWLAAGGLAVYFVVGAGGGLAAGAGVKWLAVWAAPSIVGALAIGAFGHRLDGWGVCVLLLAPVAWQVSYGWLVERGVRRGMPEPHLRSDP